MHFRGGPTPYVSDFKRASDKKIAWSEKYGQDDLSGVERRDSQMSKPMPESIRAERRDSQMSKPMPESIRAKLKMLKKAKGGKVKKCKCGCGMTMKKEKGGKLTEVCSCGCKN